MSTVSGGWRGSNIVKDGLIFYYDAGSPNSYYPPNLSLNWKDIGGNGNVATLINGPTFSGENGGNFYLDGNNDYISLGSSSAGSGTSDYTIEIFVKTVDTVGKSFVGRGRDGAGSGWSINLGTDNGNYPAFGVVTTSPFTSYYAISTTPLQTNVWYHLVGVYDYSTSVNIYVNGVLDKTNSAPGLTLRSSTEGFNIGSIGVGTTFKFNIANLKIYNRTLTLGEIQQNFNATKTKFGL